MKTTLTVAIEYDPEITDSEALACAMDRLLETALSTPDILSEYGNPSVGEFLIAKESANNSKPYTLNIDGKLFRSQRELLMKIADLARQKRPYSPMPGDGALLEGLLELTDELADQGHDQHGIDCLLVDEGDTRCECEKPGYFCSGIPGILAHMENGRLAEGAKVNRCDLCQRYHSDEAALEKLRQLDRAPS